MEGPDAHPNAGHPRHARGPGPTGVRANGVRQDRGVPHPGLVQARGATEEWCPSPRAGADQGTGGANPPRGRPPLRRPTHQDQLAEEGHRVRRSGPEGAPNNCRRALLSCCPCPSSLLPTRQDALGTVDLLVATPLRLIALLREGAVDLSRVEVVVLDEAGNKPGQPWMP